jgi:hypothetical protein
LVQSWFDGSKVNNGLIVASPDGGGNRTVTYDSREGTSAPALVINYSVPQNAAPILDSTRSPAFSAIDEDAGPPLGAVGMLVSQLVDFASPSGQVDNVTDADSGALLGIAITAADTTHGTWYYSINGGTTWSALGAVATNSARLLAADANTRLYFQPDANYNGTLASAVTFRAWDQTSGRNGALANTSTNGGSTAFSTATDTASLVINPVADIVVTPTSGLVTTEAGGTDQFTVVLDMAPTADVTIGISSSDATEGTVSTGSLTFTPTNWSTPQTVAIIGADDMLADGPVAYTIVTAAATSSDANYNGLNAGDVSVTNTDNDTVGIIVANQSGSATTEAGGTVTFTVRLNSQPTESVSIPFSSSDTTEGTVSPSSLIFTAADWNTPQTVTVTGVDDAINDGNVAYTVVIGSASSPDPLYNGLNPADISLTNTDNDLPPSSKFYVVNDASPDRTYEYDASGASVENYAINSANSAPRGIATTAAGSEFWVVDKNQKVYVYNGSGVLQRSFTAGSLSSKATVEGIATDGTNIWIVDSNKKSVYYYANAAGLNNTTASGTPFALASGNDHPRDIVFGTDGSNKYLWVVDDASTDKVFRYTVNSTTGGITLSNSWNLNSANKTPKGITIDPTNGSQDIWVVDSGTDRVYRYANGRTLTAPTLSDSFALAAGNTNPQGIADPLPASPSQPAANRTSGMSVAKSRAGAGAVADLASALDATMLSTGPLRHTTSAAHRPVGRQEASLRSVSSLRNPWTWTSMVAKGSADASRPSSQKAATKIEHSSFVLENAPTSDAIDIVLADWQ